MRLVEMILRRLRPDDHDRARKGQEIADLQAKSDATLRRADRLAPELDGAVASFRRRR